ncbi:MAG: hypothetical protein QM683_09460 [Lacrimispora sp.]
MKPEKDVRQKRRSHRRRGSRGREILISFLAILITMVLILGLTVGGVFGYRYWSGSKALKSPLETGREVEPETMGNSYE